MTLTLRSRPSSRGSRDSAGDAAAAAKIARNVNEARVAGHAHYWLDVPELHDCFARAASTDESAAEIQTALEAAGVRVTPPLDSAERWRSVRLSLGDDLVEDVEAGCIVIERWRPGNAGVALAPRRRKTSDTVWI